MNTHEPNKPAEELTEKELEGMSGGATVSNERRKACCCSNGFGRASRSRWLRH